MESRIRYCYIYDPFLPRVVTIAFHDHEEKRKWVGAWASNAVLESREASPKHLAALARQGVEFVAVHPLPNYNEITETFYGVVDRFNKKTGRAIAAGRLRKNANVLVVHRASEGAFRDNPPMAFAGFLARGAGNVPPAVRRTAINYFYHPEGARRPKLGDWPPVKIHV